MKRWITSIAVATLAFSISCVGDEASEAEPATPEETAPEAAAPTDCTGGSSITVVISRSMGDLTLDWLPDEPPIPVENFLEYVESCFYDGTIIHRVAPNFVLQGGGYTSEMQRKQTRAPITNEADNGLLNDRGTLSMARTADVNSATSQFFINLVDNNVLNHGVRDFGYAVFARVIDGMEVADQMAQVSRRGEQPEESIVIHSMRRQ